MNSSPSPVPPLEIPFEDADSVNQEAIRERHLGCFQPDDLLTHPPAYAHGTMNDAGGQLSSPTTFVSGMF